MSRRRRAEKRTVEPDPKFKSTLVEKFVNRVMIQGKKSMARKIVYDAIDQFKDKIKTEDGLEAFKQAIENAKPSLEVKSRRIGGATYQVPVEIPQDRRSALAMTWIVKHARSKVGKSMTDGLVMELSDCFNNQGSTIKKKDDTHRMAEANKAFAHFKW